MRRHLAIVALIVAVGSGLAAGQTQTGVTLAEVAKAEEARRKNVRKPAKVYTNGSLKGDFSVPVSPAASAASATPPSGNMTPAINIPGGTPPAETPAMRDQEYWSGLIGNARTTLDRSRMFADALQSRINGLRTDFVNRDDPAQKALLETQLKSALAELERVRKEMEAQQKTITGIEDEARRAGVPSGWLRPGV